MITTRLKIERSNNSSVVISLSSIIIGGEGEKAIRSK